MSASDLMIAQWKSMVEDAQDHELRRRAQVVADGKKQFEENCLTWLGELVDECVIGDVIGKWNPSIPGADYRLPFNWRGIEGWIDSGCAGHNFSHGPQMMLRPDGSLLGYEIRLALDYVVLDRCEQYRLAAREIKPLVIGEFLAIAAAKWEKYQAGKAERIKRDLQQEILLWEHCIRDADSWRALGGHIDVAMEKFPEMRERWMGAAQLAHDRLDKEEAEDKAKEALAAALKAEQERMEAEEKAKFKEFTIYKLEYGAGPNIGEETYNACDCFVLDAEGDEDGAYWEVLQGEVRRIWPKNVLRTIEVIVDAYDKIPFEIGKWEWVTSPKFPETGINVIRLPEVLWD